MVQQKNTSQVVLMVLSIIMSNYSPGLDIQLPQTIKKIIYFNYLVFGEFLAKNHNLQDFSRYLLS